MGVAEVLYLRSRLLIQPKPAAEEMKLTEPPRPSLPPLTSASIRWR